MLALALCMILPTLASCGGQSNTPADTTTSGQVGTTTPAPDTTTAVPDTTTAAPETTPAPVETTTPAPETTTPAPETTTTAPETTPAPVKTEIEVKWQLGYVGSSTHSSYAYKIHPTGGMYSYTDVITIPKAGTEISFTDDNTNSNGDTLFASASAFVVSSWKLENGEWVIDKEGANFAGSLNAASAIAFPEGNSVTYRYVTSKDNENIRLCYRSGESTSFKPAAYPTVYLTENAGPSTADNQLSAKDEYDAWIEESKKNSYFDCLNGLKVNFIGDSYFYGDKLDTQYVWCNLLAAKYDMRSLNNGKNGSTISNYVTTNNPMVDRWESAAVGNPDIIVIEGGKNDYNKNVPIGTNTDTGTTTFKGAVRFMIEKLRAKCPNALIICVTVWNVDQTSSTTGYKVTDYGDAMIEMCGLLGVPCFNAMDVSLSGVDMTSSAFRTKYCQKPTDISHLNMLGHRLVLPNFEKYIAEHYTAFTAKKG